MSDAIAWLAAEAEDVVGKTSEPEVKQDQSPHPFDTLRSLRAGSIPAKNAGIRVGHPYETGVQPWEGLPAHQFPRESPLKPKPGLNGPPISDAIDADATSEGIPVAEGMQDDTQLEEMLDPEEERRRRIYRARTVVMLRRYLKYSIETGRLPSLLGKEFFRAKVTAYTMVTFEDRVIFVHDMETCLERLDEFSRELIARHVLQEHDQAATARLLGCTERTVRRLAPLALDQMSEILLDVGMMKRLDEHNGKSCQGGLEGQFSVSDCEDGENKF